MRRTLPLAIVLIAGIAIAAPDSKAPAPNVDKLINQLTGKSFKGRVEASKQLYAVGADAIDALQKGAEELELEGATRCFQVLKRLSESSDKATADAATAALKKLAESKGSPVAGRAAEAIKPPAPELPANRNPFGAPRIIIGGAGGGGIIGPGGKFQFKRQSEVTENGRTVKIVETQDGIEIKVTEEVDGKQQTKTYKAKNAADLKKKHPKIHEIYKKQMGNQKLPRLRINGRAIPFRIQPRVIRPRRVNPRNIRRGGNRGIQVQEQNGKRQIKLVENGRTIEAQDENGKNIIVRITPKALDQESKIIKAKDLAELKKKDAKVAEEYEKLIKEAKQNQTLQPAIPNFPRVLPIKPIQPGAANPFGIPNIQLPQFGGNKEQQKKMADAQKSLNKAMQDFSEAMRNRPVDRDQIRALTDALRKAQREMIEAMRP